MPQLTYGALHKFAFMALGMVFLAGCVGQNTVRSKPSYDDYLSQLPTYGAWKIDGCTATARAGDLLFKTTADISNDLLYIKMLSGIRLKDSPTVLFTHTKVVPEIEGANKAYSIQFPYLPYVVKDMIKNNSHMIVRYQLSTENMPKEVFLPAYNIAMVVAHLRRSCG